MTQQAEARENRGNLFKKFMTKGLPRETSLDNYDF